MNNNLTEREKALQFWSTLSKEDKDKLWKDLKSSQFTPSHNADELTGREIEIIWKQEINKKSFQDFLETVPDEFICIDDDMECVSSQIVETRKM